MKPAPRRSVGQRISDQIREFSGFPAGPPRAPLSFNEVFLAELRALRPGRFDKATAVPMPPVRSKRERAEETRAQRDADSANRAGNLRSLFALIAPKRKRPRRAEEEAAGGGGPAPLSALCLSGGGIRSATFNLGVLQALARLGVLGKFDYLSSVSGGGYINGWLHAWFYHAEKGRDPVAAQETVCAELGRSRPAHARSGETRAHATADQPANPLHPEPEPIDHLREFSNFLTPKVGLFSLDSWTLGAIVLRNLILNWLLLVPLLAGAIAAPQVTPYVLRWRISSAGIAWLLSIAAGFGLLSSFFVHRYRGMVFGQKVSSIKVLLLAVLPLYFSAVFLAWAAARRPPMACDGTAAPASLGYWIGAGVWSLLLPFLGWLANAPKWRKRMKHGWPWFELMGLVVSGALATWILVTLAHAMAPCATKNTNAYAALALPALLGTYLLARVIFVAFSSMGENRHGPVVARVEDHDREWWARLSGWILMAGVGWLVVAGLCLYGPELLESFQKYWATEILAALGGVSGVVIKVVGSGVGTFSGRRTDQASPSTGRAWALKLAAAVFCVVLFIFVAQLTSKLGIAMTLHKTAFDDDSTGPLQLSWLLRFVSASALLIVLALLLGWVVNINHFSLQGMYRNRLVRAYLGASNLGRKPDPFTGFALADDIALATLVARPPPPSGARLLPVVNATLNLTTTTDKLAWQQRKAESFSMTPLYCGNFYDGYRPTYEYGGPDGVTLGTAMAISGAAANPNMGYHSSPVITFLLTLLNARLGAWLGNPGESGARTYFLPGPRWSVRPIVAELLGETSNTHPYVNLSDGGHFENLGLYEMVLRRCRSIVVSDCGADPHGSFADLGNAIRKIRVDFGISIEFAPPIRIAAPGEARAGLYCAVGTIRYSEVDGEVEDGRIIYLKPTTHVLASPPPYDVQSYVKGSETYPQESTIDQWFDESQFESYRALGWHAAGEVAKGDSPAGSDADWPTFNSVNAFIEAAIKYAAAGDTAEVARGAAGSRARAGTAPAFPSAP